MLGFLSPLPRCAPRRVVPHLTPMRRRSSGIRFTVFLSGLLLSTPLGHVWAATTESRTGEFAKESSVTAASETQPTQTTQPTRTSLIALDRVRQTGARALDDRVEAMVARAPFDLGHPEARVPFEQAPLEGGGSTASTWAPYTGPFGIEEAAHLMRRVVVGATWAEIEQAAAQGLHATVQQLLAPEAAPTPPGPWATEPIPDTSTWTEAMIDSLVEVYLERDTVLRGWWPDVILQSPPNATETMTHFWHDHFATGMDKVFYPQSMYVQNALLRQHALGNFKDLTLAVSLDPAMLLWLDNQWNRVGDINENFARELLELFTLGVGHYTQQDVIEVARSFTGYVTWDGVTSQLLPWEHDYGDKTIFGQTGDWAAEEVIELIFARDECARFLCGKLYQWFVDEYPDPVRLEQLAQILRANDYEVAPVLETILLSEHFFDPEFRGSLISDGLDHYVGRPRAFGMAGQIQFADYMTNQREWMDWCMWIYSHVLFDPPNVAGWPGYRTWVNSYTLPWRKELTVALVEGEIYGWPLGMQLDIMAFGESLSAPHDAYQVVDDVATVCFGMPPTDLVRQRMLDELLQGAEPWEWSLFDPQAPDRLRDLVTLALRLPDAQSK